MENQICTEIGIPNISEKKERLVVDEANKKDYETQINIDLWLENINESLKLVNKMFNLNITARKRYDYQSNVVEEVKVVE